jgi:hypothetical protein
MTYTFDCAYDCPLGEFLKVLNEFELKLVSFIPEGPGGGNPEITVTGSEKLIKQFHNYWDL